MTDIKLIHKDTNIDSLKIYKLDWDAVLYGKPYQVVKIDGYVHTIGGKWGDNNLWAYPLNEKPTYENLLQFDADCAVCWGINYQPHLYCRCKWDENEILRSSGLTITRNGEKFCEAYSLADAQVKIEQFLQHPLDLNLRGYAEKAIGRKVWWRSEPAVITSWCKGQACVILEPDGIDRFTTPAEFADEDIEYYEDSTVKASILDHHIWWFRE